MSGQFRVPRVVIAPEQFVGASGYTNPWDLGHNLNPNGYAPAHGQTPAPRQNPFTDQLLDPQHTFLIADKSRWSNFQSDFKTLLQGESVQLLSEPTNIRSSLYVRVAASSSGSLAIAFNNRLANVDQAEWIINAGGDSQMLWLYTIPQNRLFAFANGGDVTYKLVWAETRIAS